MRGKRRLDGGDLRGQRFLRELVALGQDGEEGHRALVERGHDGLVGRRDAAPRVEQQADPLQRRPASQVGLRKACPCLDLLPGGRGIAVARQIDEREPAVQVEEVQLARAPRRVGCARQRAPARERVDEARLADVGTAGEGDLGQAGRGQAVGARCTRDEAAGPREQPAAGVKRL